MTVELSKNQVEILINIVNACTIKGAEAEILVELKAALAKAKE